MSLRLARHVTRWLGVLAVVGLALPAGARAAPGTITDAQRLASMEATTEQIRQLRHVAPVVVKFASNSAFDAAVRASLSRDNPGAQIAVGQRELVLEGLLGASTNLKQILIQSPGSRVAGFYDPASKSLYVRGQGNVLSGADRSTIAREYTHALQDQHYHLSRLIPDLSRLAYRNSDAVFAHRALVEGDAETTQLLFIARTYSPDDMKALAAEAATASVSQVPRALQREFDFPYATGTHFVQTLYRAGGMSAVDGAYTRLPGSTYEIMHPSAYLEHWKPLNVRLHSVQGFTDWQTLDDDVLGALGYQLLFWQHDSLKAATAATAAYRGDRYVLLSKQGRTVMLLRSVWATGKAAALARSTYMHGLRARFPGSPAQPGPGGTTVNAASESVYVAVHGKTMTVAYGPDQATVQAVGQAPTV